jgi:Tol biopolymer transport system component
MGWVLAAAAIATAAGVAFMGRSREPAADTIRFSIAPQRGRVIALSQNRSRLAISPDGRHLAYQASVEGRQQLWIHSLASSDARPVAGTEGGYSPFWSPDSRFLGFYVPTAGEIRKVDISGGPARTISSAVGGRDKPGPLQHEGSLTWGRDGTILFTQFRDGLYRVSADGGTAVRVTRVDKTKGEMNHYWPSFLPDGRHFLYMATAIDSSQRRVTPSVYVGSLDDASDVKLVTRVHSKMIYVPTGHVLFVEDGALMAQAFDIASRSLQGEPVSVADGIGFFKPLGNAAFDISDTGVLAYQGVADTFRLVWYDRRGTATETGWEAQNFGGVRFSPDAQRFAIDVTNPRTGMSDVWIYDVARGAPTRLTTDGYAGSPVWSSDGRRVVFNTGRSQAPALAARALDGTEEKLADRNSPLVPEDWSPDGRWLAFTNNTRTTGLDVWLLPLAGDRKERAFATTNAQEWDAKFSPDSSQLAFVSNEYGSPEVFVSAVGGGEKIRISDSGGHSPRWRRDGKELFYMAPDNRTIMAVPIELGATFKAGVPVRLFTMRTEAASRITLRYSGFDVLPDGQRFLVTVPLEAGSTRMHVVVNWMTMLRR